MTTLKQYKKGDEVETIHGETLTVLKVEEVPAVTKKGVALKEGHTRILAESGGHPTWFPLSRIKESAADPKIKKSDA